uniref:Gag-Pol polyprotein n=1 Tax=Tanacetum cinerariifolium TaxID=118510 RepID=A0A6L2L162_TANCI|nr:Gag-Pol polyprotein [Tanacetum cinerariifolium]
MAAKFKIEKFNGNNFSLLKLKMKAILRKDKCLAAIGERPAKVTDDSKWDKMDGNAVANLYLTLTDGVLSSMKEKKSAKEIWDHLAQLYEARTLHNKIFLKRKLYALHMTESTSVTEHVNNLNTLFSQLTSLSCIIEPQELFNDVVVAILDEENRRTNREDRQTSSRQVEALVVKRGRSMEPDSSGSHNHEDGNALCCELSVANEIRKRFTDVWLFDTGATFHMTTRREWFHEYKPISRVGFVYSCNDHELKIIRIRSIMVKMHDGTVSTIRDVQLVEGLKKNLLSLGQLDDLGCKEAKALVASHSPSNRVAVTWHLKLGHMSEQGMKILVERKLFPGLTKVSLPFCKHCVISMQHRLKFKTSNSKSVYVLELVHSDVWQAPVLSLVGAKYFVSFIDDYSRRCWVYPIKKKYDVFKVFKVYKAWVKLDSGKKIKCLRTDNESEYTGDEFDTFCRQEGIKRQFTTAYTPQHNGVAERMNRTLLEIARAMLETTSLGKSF